MYKYTDVIRKCPIYVKLVIQHMVSYLVFKRLIFFFLTFKLFSDISEDIPVSITTVYPAFLVSIFFLAGLLHTREITCLFHGICFLLCTPAAYLLLIIYSICNLTDSSWGKIDSVFNLTLLKHL